MPYNHLPSRLLRQAAVPRRASVSAQCHDGRRRRGLGVACVLGACILGLGLLASSGSAQARPRVAESGPSAGGSPLVVNEVDYFQHAQEDSAEFVELQNVSGKPIALGGFDVVGINGRGGEYRRFHLPAVPLGPGEYYVLCGRTNLVPNCDLVVTPALNTWLDKATSTPAIAFNAIAVVRNATGSPDDDVLVDSVSYDGNVPGGPRSGGSWTEGKGVVPGDDTNGAWLGISRVPDGTDTDDNSADFALSCITPGYKNTDVAGGPNGCPSPVRQPTLVLNEADYMQPGAIDDSEFVELKNVSGHVIELGTWWAVLGIDATGTQYSRFPLSRFTLLPNHYYVLCGAVAQVPNCDQVVSPGTNTWQDPQVRTSPINAIALVLSPNGKPAEDVLVDSVAYDGDIKGGPAAGGNWTEATPIIAGDDANTFRVGISRWPDGTDTDHNNDDFQGLRCITPGYTNTIAGQPGAAACGQPATVTPTPSRTPTPTATATPTASATPPPPTPTAADLPTQPGPTQTATDEPTATPTDRRPPTDTPAPRPSDTPGPTPTVPSRFDLDLAVNSPDNASDIRLGDGICDAGVGACTLRAALMEVDALAGAQKTWRIRIARQLRIEVPVRDPLPAVRHNNGLIQGAVVPSGANVAVDPAVGAWAQSVAEELASRSVEPDVTLTGPGVENNMIGLELNGAARVAVQGLRIEGFRLGIAVHNGSDHVLIGTNADGNNDDLESNHLTDNVQAGISIDASSTNNTVRANMLNKNGWSGIRMARTKAGQNTLSQNLFHANGAAGIVVVPSGAELDPPVINPIVRASGQATGHACPGCAVEVFADTMDQAQVYLGRADADAAGVWKIAGVNLAIAEVNLTATNTDAAGNTSRLSAPAPIGGLASLWHLVEVSPNSPRSLGRGRTLERSYRLLDGLGNPVPNVKVRWSPLDAEFTTDENGLVICIVPIDINARFTSAGLTMSVEAVSRDGISHAVLWNPRMAAAKARVGDPEGILLDMSNLSPKGLGATLKGGTLEWAGLYSGLSTFFDRLNGPGQFTLNHPDQFSQSYGAAFAAAPVEDMREGQYAWQENMARGGGIYELRAVGETLSGELEIVAPKEAYNTGGPSSGCTGTSAGAVIAGWRHDSKCWVPAPGVSVSAPPPGSSTFSAHATVDIGAGGLSELELGATGASGLHQTATYTLYTVGFDIDPPVITPTIASNAVIVRLPAVIALASDKHAGVDATAGVTLTVGGVPVPVNYDADTFEIRVPAQHRALPPGLSGSGQISITAADGFCNQKTVPVNVTFSTGGRPTPDPARPFKIFAPYTPKNSRVH